MGVGNDPTYNHSDCFNPFPFPDATEVQKSRLRALGEELDAHRKAQQAAHPRLTLTALYNVLEKLRAGERIEGRDRKPMTRALWASCATSTTASTPPWPRPMAGPPAWTTRPS
ncbi:hypothetical protein ACFSYD_26380 [Paracoccus aerius]